MSHRGRLNVLANVLQKSYKRIFNEFAGEMSGNIKDSAGDVKYHLGAPKWYFTSPALSLMLPLISPANSLKILL